MTSTEVQRTLVKSAPEIWAELSDPAALGRHLDPVGDIRITRAEPEQKVEWEAEGACGTVLIRPSGWGTRVTLTMNRQDGEAEPDAVPEAAGPAGPEVPSEPAAPSEADRKPEPAAATGTEHFDPERATVTDADEADGATVSDAAVENEGATLSHAPDEALEQDLPPAPAAGEPVEEPEPEPVGEAAASPLEPEAEPVGAAPGVRAELLPRRRLLARLLGRRRRPSVSGSSGGAGSFHGLATQSPGVSPWPIASAEWVHRFPRREGDFEIAPTSEPEPAPAEILGEEEAPAEAQSPGGDDPTLDVGAPPAVAGADGHPESIAAYTTEAGQAASAEPGTGLAQQETGPAQQETGPGDEETGPAEQESAAAERDAAVLSAVLDRLGAAHHRPFSRA